jgi:ABC-type transport system involved in multi-copper enzyme maturation permease subunit
MHPGNATPSLLPGCTVLFRKELLEGRRSKRILFFVLIMTGALALIPVIGYLRFENLGSGTRHEISSDSMHGLLGSWSAIVGYLGSLMVIASTVDAMTRERSLGISAWILTKPVSRPSYVVAKASAHTAINIVTLVLIPTAVWLAITFVLFAGVPASRMLLAAGILSIEVFFLSFVTIALGVPFRSVTPVSLVALAVWFLPNLLPAIGSLNWTYRILPSYLPLAAVSAAIDEMSWPTLTVPLAAVCGAVVLTLLALVQFERQEL